jgi:cobalt-zinc-cadmium efflux system membrane fusion protein
MKIKTMALSALLLAGALAGFPSHAYSQDEHAGHDHDEHEHEAGAHAQEPAEEAHDDHEGHDDHAGHGDEEEGHTDEVTLSEEAIRRFNITTARAERRVLTGTATVPARVSFNTEAMAHIGTQVQGRVLEIAVRLGDEVEQGQLLLVIDSPELGTAQSTYLQEDAAVEAAKINVEAAEGLVEVAQTAFERAEMLRESNGISITEYLERQGALREAEANVRKAQAELRVAESERLAAENQLHIYGYGHEHCDELLATGEIHTRYEVFAPIDGQVVQREVTPGEVVDPSDEALMVLANMDELWVLGDVPERLIGRVAVGTPARVTMTALPEMAFDGTISYIAPQLDPRTRTASVRIVVPSAAPATHRGGHEVEDHSGHDHDEMHEEGDSGEDLSGHDHDESYTEHDDGHDGDDHEGEDHFDHNHGEEEVRHDDHSDEDSEGESHIAGQLLKPGMFGQAELSLTALPGQSSQPVLAVPEDAIQDIEGGPAVFVTVPGEPNTYMMRSLHVGPRVGRWVPVLSGLSEGEEYVASQTFILKAELGKSGAEHAHAH